MTARFRIGQRIAASAPNLLAKHIPVGTTGWITDRIGFRSFEAIFDGDPRPVHCLPECLAPADPNAPSRPAPSPFRFKARGSSGKQKEIQ
jgi:hypothetical protein